MNDIAKQLREVARKSGMSINALALRAKLPYQTVHGFMTGDRHITIQSAAKLAALLDLELCPRRRRTGIKKKGG